MDQTLINFPWDDDNDEGSLFNFPRDDDNDVETLFNFPWDDDDDEEIVEFVNRPREVRFIAARSNLFETLPESKFVRRFRLTKQTTLLLLHQIQDEIEHKTNRNEAVSPMNQLLCTLRFYATGSQIISCGDLIGIQEATACRIIHRVTHAIASLYKRYIHFPDHDEEQEELARTFYRIAKFPRVNGCIDCTHVKIISPGGNNAEIYRNRKGYFSINTQCVAVVDLTFVNVVARWHGSAHDSNIWDNCALKRNFMLGKYKDKILLGDNGYSQTGYMMTPLPDGSAETRAQALYQEAHIKTRNVVERAFGIWKRRFPILSRGISLRLQRVPGIIIATAVLHNIAIGQKEVVPPVDPEYPVLSELPDLSRPPQQQQSRNFERSVLINDYFSRL